MSTLEQRIHKIAMKVAPDYPNISECSPNEQLWAIESSYFGIHTAVISWQKYGYILKKEFNITDEQWIEFFNMMEKL